MEGVPTDEGQPVTEQIRKPITYMVAIDGSDASEVAF